MSKRMTITAAGSNGKMGHASLASNGDDGLVHITAMRRRGSKIVEVGSYSISGEKLLAIAQHAITRGEVGGPAAETMSTETSVRQHPAHTIMDQGIEIGAVRSSGEGENKS